MEVERERGRALLSRPLVSLRFFFWRCRRWGPFCFFPLLPLRLSSSLFSSLQRGDRALRSGEDSGAERRGTQSVKGADRRAVWPPAVENVRQRSLRSEKKKSGRLAAPMNLFLFFDGRCRRFPRRILSFLPR